MNIESKKIRKTNPRQGASPLSVLFLGFTFPTFRKGLKNEIGDDDVYEVLNCCESEKLGDCFELEWQKELTKEKPSLLRAMFRMFGVKYFSLSIFIFIYETTLVTILEPILIGKVTSYFEGEKNMSIKEGSLYVFALTASSIVLALCNNLFLLSLRTICLRMRIALTSLIYRKCLTLNADSSASFVGGRAVNLITKDVDPIFEAADCAQMIIVGVPQFVVMLILAYNQIGLAALAGASIILVLIPINSNVYAIFTVLQFINSLTYLTHSVPTTNSSLPWLETSIMLGKLTSSYRLKSASKTDARVKKTQEILAAVKIIKMYTWESFFLKNVNKLRTLEIQNLKILFYVKAVAVSLGQLSSRLAFYICVITYVALGNRITAEKAFIVVSCFGAVRGMLTTYMPSAVTQMADMRASFHRLNSFLTLDEVQGFKSFHATDDLGIFLKDVDYKITKGLTMILGPTGSGKSALLKVILGDLPKISGNVRISGKMSYASQEPWLFPSTVRQNILFGEAFDQERYQKVIEVCALTKDLEVMHEGDRTLVMDRGLNLSKGQKARINLARAVYRKADIYLLDDSLSSVDSFVGSHIFKECLQNFLKDCICILVTHNSNLMIHADDLIVMDKGSVQFRGTYKAYQEFGNFNLKAVLRKATEITHNFDKVPEKLKADDFEASNELSHLLPKSSYDGNIYEEPNQVGKVNKQVYCDYLSSAGGVKMFALVFVAFVLAQAASSLSDYFVSFWVDTEQELTEHTLNNTSNSTEYKDLKQSHALIMKSYSFIMLAAACLIFLRSFMFFIFSSKASTNIHKTVLNKVVKGVVTFFDSHLYGTVLNRFSRDLSIIDEYMPTTIFDCINALLQITGVFVVVSSVNLYFIVPSIAFLIILYFARWLYLPTGRSLRRLEGSSRSPAIGHLNSTLEGLPTIRASEVQKTLRKEFDNSLNVYNSVLYMNIVATRALALYLNLTCILYIAVITITFLFVKSDTLAGKVGLAITQSFTLTGFLQWGIRSWAELENQMTSTERVLEYRHAKAEGTCGEAPKNWPQQGRVTFKNVNLTYATHAERILKNLCFQILPREKVGIVGRTGAGKTSITSILLRMYDFEGIITVDDVDINTISIVALRSKISIIPQDPILFSGTIRSNLDPYSEYSDKTLWAALDKVEMKSRIKDLNQEICQGDLSIGEKQLFCIARAVLRDNLIVILDEATANVDDCTEELIQKTIKNLFSHCTVITIAHKLQTILDSDKVLVMDFGEIVQFGTPTELLENKGGLFYQMVRGGDY